MYIYLHYARVDKKGACWGFEHTKCLHKSTCMLFGTGMLVSISCPLCHCFNQNYRTQNGKMRKFTHFISNNLSIGKCVRMMTEAERLFIRADKTNTYRYLRLHKRLGTCVCFVVATCPNAQWHIRSWWPPSHVRW